MSAKRRVTTVKPLAVTNAQPGECIKFSPPSKWKNTAAVLSVNALSVLDLLIKNLEIEGDGESIRYLHSKPIVHCLDDTASSYSATIVVKDYRNRRIWNITVSDMPIEEVEVTGICQTEWNYPVRHLPVIAIQGVARYIEDNKNWNMTSNPVFCNTFYFGTDGNNNIVMADQQDAVVPELYIVDGKRAMRIGVSASPFVDNPLI